MKALQRPKSYYLILQRCVRVRWQQVPPIQTSYLPTYIATVHKIIIQLEAQT